MTVTERFPTLLFFLETIDFYSSQNVFFLTSLFLKQFFRTLFDEFHKILIFSQISKLC